MFLWLSIKENKPRETDNSSKKRENLMQMWYDSNNSVIKKNTNVEKLLRIYDAENHTVLWNVFLLVYSGCWGVR